MHSAICRHHFVNMPECLKRSKPIRVFENINLLILSEKEYYGFYDFFWLDVRHLKYFNKYCLHCQAGDCQPCDASHVFFSWESMSIISVCLRCPFISMAAFSLSPVFSTIFPVFCLIRSFDSWFLQSCLLPAHPSHSLNFLHQQPSRLHASAVAFSTEHHIHYHHMVPIYPLRFNNYTEQIPVGSCKPDKGHSSTCSNINHHF